MVAGFQSVIMTMLASVRVCVWSSGHTRLRLCPMEHTLVCLVMNPEIHRMYVTIRDIFTVHSDRDMHATVRTISCTQPNRGSVTSAGACRRRLELHFEMRQPRHRLEIRDTFSCAAFAVSSMIHEREALNSVKASLDEKDIGVRITALAVSYVPWHTRDRRDRAHRYGRRTREELF